ncbi:MULTISPECIES: S-layer homology domain-containing protein [Paenibacillus]|uniref:SLH domain-containing protein n=1 Tax=Paenibacillus albilobatus TaxID=2716884 RepID=A0A919XIE5_9BACL|nr:MULTISPECIES: S-layer homology domain-containing protein [Paenibacillus]GIO31455.1 hypothetical protein J2TS6_25960 [Paenibacillus albilobatus]
MRGKPGKWPLIIILALFIQTSLGNGVSSPIFAASSNQPPVLKTSGGSAFFIAGDNTTSMPVIIDNGLTLSDPDNTTLSSATVAITGNIHPGEDTLAFTGNNAALYGNIKASYDSSSAVLTLTSSGATATVAQWQSALRSVTYTNTAITPNTETRTISFSVNDGTSVSNSATKTVTVTAVDQTPVLTTSDGPTVFKVEAGGTRTPVIVDSGLTVSDRDNSTLSSAFVAVTAHYQPGYDVLTFIDTNTSQYGNITASYNLSTGVLTLTSAGATATVAQWQNALRSVTYSNSKNAPNTSVRTISFSINDGIKTSDATTKTIIVTPANQAPVFVSTSSGEANFTTGDNGHGKSVVIDPDMKITASGGTALASGTVAITDHFQSGEDVLAFSNVSEAVHGNITSNYNAGTGVLALTSAGATATVEQWQNALRSVTYANTNSTPNTAERVISFTVNDGKANSNTATKSVALEALQLTSLSANPATVTVQAGQSTSTVITATYSDQSQLDVTPYVSWTVQKPEVASVSGGTITGLSPGSTVLTAVYGTRSVDISLTVTSIPGHGGDSGGNNGGNNGGNDRGNDVSGGGGGGGGNSNPSPAVPSPVTPPVQKASAFYPFVDLDRLAAFIKAALASGNAPDFKDAASHWAAGDIRLAAKLGITKGYQDGTFRPNAAITRAEFSTLLVKAFALRQGGETKTFDDVQSSWARESVEISASLGVIGGYPDGTFRPDRPMTRAEMVAMVSKLIVLQKNVSGKRGPFIDVAPQHWAGKLIEEAAAAGIIQGKTRDTFAPNDNITRAEAVTVILRMLRTEPTLKDLLK